MNRFSDASLRGGIPKTLVAMKKYIIPNTESMETVQCFAICDPSAGKGAGLPVGRPTGGPKGAPERVF
jgi:hypothetical protein